MSYDHNPCVFYEVAIRLELMFNQNGLLSQKVCCYLDQDHTLKDMLMTAARLMAYFDLSKLNLA